ncbi:MAG TPA: VanZ family protein, partial [Gallionellaceae bacterium]|nr:VanZ family protein [Gallionellaceae bacterium]
MAAKHDPAVSTSARRYVVAGYVLLIVYASLSPFTGWRDQGFTFADVLTAPLSLTYNAMDAWVNVVAYIPFGMLAALTLLPRLRARWSISVTLAAGMALSAAMEFLQMYLPTRTSSNLDILTNSAGTLAGALLALRIAPTPWFAGLTDWRRARIRRGPGADFGLALVALWMFVQVNPSLPMLGNIFISETARAPFQPPAAEPFNWLGASAAALNLLMLGCLYLTLLRRRRHVLTAVVLSMSL